MNLKKKFAIAAGALLIAVSGGIGADAAINGVNNQTVSTDSTSLHAVSLKGVFEKQTFDTADYHYWCWSVASIACPIRVQQGDQPAYNALQQQLKP